MNSKETQMTDAVLDIRSASTSIKLTYTLAVLAIYPIAIVGSSGWVAIAMGAGVNWWILVALLVGVWRVYQVWTKGSTLSAPIPTAAIGVLRWIGLLLMAATVVLALALFFQKQVAGLFFSGKSDTGIEFFVLKMYATLIGSLTTSGILLFELSRLLGFEHREHHARGGIRQNGALQVMTGAKNVEAAIDESRAMRVLYALGILVLLLMLVISSWRWMRSGSVANPVILVLPAVPMCLMYTCRILSLIAKPNGFVRWTRGIAKWLRAIAVWFLIPSILSSITVQLYTLFPSDLGGVSSIALTVAVLMSSISFYCLALFDFARLLGFEKRHRAKDSL